MVIEANEAVEEGGAFNAENSEYDVRTSTISANKAKNWHRTSKLCYLLQTKIKMKIHSKKLLSQQFFKISRITECPV